MAEPLDDDMLDSALIAAAERDRGDVASTWYAIMGDLRQRGPFAKMILSFRASAVEAIKDLIFIPATDPEVLRLQKEIRRYIETIEMIHGYREGAQAIDANVEADVSEEGERFINTLIEEEEIE